MKATMKKLFLAVVLFRAVTGAQAWAGPYWDQLTQAQRSTLLSGQQVVLDNSTASYWQVAVYGWVNPQPKVHTADPEGSAAVFWDLESQPSYLGSFGLQSIAITQGKGTAAVRSVVTGLIPTPQGLRPYSYPWENAVFRSGQSYSVSWHSPDPAQPFFPGVPSVWGGVSFESFPGDQGGALMRYELDAIPVAALIQDPKFKALFLGQVSLIGGAHVNRMRQGASRSQIRALRRALR